MPDLTKAEALATLREAGVTLAIHESELDPSLLLELAEVAKRWSQAEPSDLRPDPDPSWTGHYIATCGNCDEEFGTNFRIEEIECPNCDAHRCPHCLTWFGGVDA